MGRAPSVLPCQAPSHSLFLSLSPLTPSSYMPFSWGKKAPSKGPGAQSSEAMFRSSAKSSSEAVHRGGDSKGR